MRISRIVLAAALFLCFALPAAAQYIGVLQSAETNDRGTFKIQIAPIVALGKNGADDDYGLAARGGYGFTDRFDAEVKLGSFRNSRYIGADGEFWILKGAEKDTGIDFSVTGGLHWIFGKRSNFDIMGLDITPLVSGHINKDLELCGSLDISFESIQNAPRGYDDTFTRLHLVPGVEYRLSQSIDLDGEIGIALDDDSWTYLAAGITFYLR
jgi:hypothetical protein